VQNNSEQNKIETKVGESFQNLTASINKIFRFPKLISELNLAF